MQEPSSVVELPFPEADEPLLRDVGRPRSILDVEGALGPAAAPARVHGAQIVSASLASLASLTAPAALGAPDTLAQLRPGARFDLVVCRASSLGVGAPEQAAAHVAALRRRLEDGGHLLLSVAAARDVSAMAALLRGAGLAVLRVSARAAPFGGARLLVARRPPRPGPLSITIGMLTLDEAGCIERMIDDIRAVAPDAKLLVVDSSSDDTPRLAQAKGARVVRQLPARGHGPAMRRLMYEAARESDALIYLDCDCTYPTSHIPRVRALLEAGADVVNATRTHAYPSAMPITHFVANRVFAAAVRAVHGLRTTDVHSGMRGYRASVIRAFDFDGRGDALPIDTLVLPARSRYRVEELPIPYFARVGASKLARVRGTVWTFVRIVRAIGEGTRVRDAH